MAQNYIACGDTYISLMNLAYLYKDPLDNTRIMVSFSQGEDDTPLQYANSTEVNDTLAIAEQTLLKVVGTNGTWYANLAVLRLAQKITSDSVLVYSVHGPSFVAEFATGGEADDLVDIITANFNPYFATKADNLADLSDIEEAKDNMGFLMEDIDGLEDAVAGKVDKVTGKGLSTNDYTNTDKAKVAALGSASEIALVSGLIPAAYLPSYVDDVLEYAATGNFPGTGEAGKIYVATGTGKIYRWSGSAYVEISPSPGSTDSVTEGSTNLYFTNARAVAALSSALALKPIVYLGATQKSNVKMLAKSASTTSGTATFYLTSDGTGSGTALFTNVYDETIDFEVNDSANAYRYGWTLSGDKKTLTVTVTRSTSTGVISLLGLNLLSAPTATPNGTSVRLTIWGD